MWNSTLVEDYPHVDSVLINAVGRLQLPTDLARQQMRHDDEVTIGVIAYPDGLGETGIQGCVTETITIQFLRKKNYILKY